MGSTETYIAIGVLLGLLGIVVILVVIRCCRCVKNMRQNELENAAQASGDYDGTLMALMSATTASFQPVLVSHFYPRVHAVYYTAGYTFCFVGVVVVVATFNQTWHYFSRQLIKHD
jgi:hypothetical protein